MKIHRVEQGTAEWKDVRLGIPTASWFHTIITPLGKRTDNRERKKYMYRLVAERLLRQPMPDSFVNSWMERGNDLEDAAARALAKKLDVEFSPGGFVTDNKGLIGCSPDRIIERLGPAMKGAGKPTEAVEIKVPSPWVHLANLCEGPGDKYKAQVQGQIMIGEFEAVHFYSWNPNLPEFHKMTLPDDKYIRTMDVLLTEFLDELATTEDFVRRKGGVIEMTEAALSGHFPWGDP